MNLWIKAAVLTSTALLLFFAHSLYKLNSRVFVPEVSYLAPVVVPPPLVRTDVSLEQLIDKLPSDQQCFRQVFFEVMNLCGLQQTRLGNWLAIFIDDRGNLIKLAAGQTHDGVRVNSVDATGCTVIYGSIERKFELP